MLLLTQQVVRRVWSEIEGQLSEQGYELVEVEYGQHGASNILRVYLDREGGINIDDCAKASRFLSPCLDLCDFMAEQYLLEVSSPGIARPIRKESDFARFVGEAVKLQAIEPVQGRKRFKGILQGFHDGLICVAVDGETYEIHIENLKRAILDR